MIIEDEDKALMMFGRRKCILFSCNEQLISYHTTPSKPYPALNPASPIAIQPQHHMTARLGPIGKLPTLVDPSLGNDYRELPADVLPAENETRSVTSASGAVFRPPI